MNEPYFDTSKNGWYVYYTTAEGCRRRKALGQRKKEAFDKWRELLANAKALTHPDRPFRSIANDWLLRQKSRYEKGEVSLVWLTRASRTVSRFTTAYPNVKCANITETLVTEWLGADASSDYERTEVGTIKQIIRWAKAQSPILDMRLTKGRARQVVLTLAQHERLVEEASGDQFKLLLRFAWWTGARPSELRDLKWENVEADLSRAVLRDHKTAKKTRKPRVLYFNAEAQGALRSITTRKGYVFVNRNRKPWTKDALTKRMSNLEDATGIRATAYAYRHSYATRALKAGVSAATVAELIGTSLEMLQYHYGHLDAEKEHLRAAASCL